MIGASHRTLAILAITSLHIVGSFIVGVDGFTIPTSDRWTASPSTTSPSALFAGMGMSSTSKGSTKKKSKGSNSSNKKQKSPPFDVAASLLKMERKHDDMQQKSAKVKSKDDDDILDSDMVISEFMVAARAARSSTGSADLTSVADWIPVAQLSLLRPIIDLERSDGANDKVVHAAISYYCREIAHAACLGATKFRDVPRQELQYSVESLDSFHRFVFDHMNGKNGAKEGSMTKAEARKVLQLEDGVTDKATIKQSYRKLTFSLHPDRFVGVERSSDEEEASDDAFARVKLAFDTLSSGVSDANGSWYQSLGGKERSDFVGPIDLLTIADAKTVLDAHKHDCAVLSLDAEIVQPYLLRNQNA